MKKTLIVMIALMATLSAFAGRIELTRDTALITDNGSYIGDYGWFLNGTRMTISDRSTFLYSRGRDVEVHRVDRVDTRGMYGRRLENARDINDRYVDVYIKRSDLLNNSVRDRGSRPSVDTRPSRPVRDNSYEVCYEQPRQKVVRINSEQRRRGENQVAGGFAGVIGGLIIGDVLEDQRLGNVISAIGAGFVVAGGVNMAQSREVIFENHLNCRQYYTVDRTHRFSRGRETCTTTRYYTSRWGQTTEYFETQCSRGGRYLTFERNREIWY